MADEGQQGLKLVFTAHSKRMFYCRDAVCQYVFSCGNVPLNPFRAFGYYLGDRIDHDFVRRANDTVLARSDELWVFGETVANGVLAEIATALRLNMPVHYFTIAANASEIREICADDLHFEPEVHAPGIRRSELIAFVKGERPVSGEQLSFSALISTE